MRPRVTLYTRTGCCLCDTAKAVIAKAGARADFDYEERDIDQDQDLRRLYNEEVPVIAIDGIDVFRYAVDLEELIRRLQRR
jgi:glutaredoxin